VGIPVDTDAQINLFCARIVLVFSNKLQDCVRRFRREGFKQGISPQGSQWVRPQIVHVVSLN